MMLSKFVFLCREKATIIVAIDVVNLLFIFMSLTIHIMPLYANHIPVILKY